MNFFKQIFNRVEVRITKPMLNNIKLSQCFYIVKKHEFQFLMHEHMFCRRVVSLFIVKGTNE